MQEVMIYTDGACRGNPGPGGWGALLRFNGHEKQLSGGEHQTTNNRMEMTAVIKALEQLKRPCRIILTTDSRYVIQGITEWLPGWKRRQWRNAAGKPVLNVDLWKRLEDQVSQHEIQWQWVKGHSGHPENELADALANRGIDELLVE